MRDLVVWRRSESPSFDRAIVTNVADQAVQRGVTIGGVTNRWSKLLFPAIVHSALNERVIDFDEAC